MTENKSNFEKELDDKNIKEDLTEKLHPLERKFGKEPKVKDEDLWNWH